MDGRRARHHRPGGRLHRRKSRPHPGDLWFRPLFWSLIVAELGIVMALSWAIKHMSPVMAISAFLFYAALNGLTLSMIFLIYTAESTA